MKKILYLLMVISILSVSAMAETVSIISSTSGTNASGTIITGIPYLTVSMVNQDPSPADPGAYVNVLFKIENRGTVAAENSTIEILSAYPFSLDSGISSVTELGKINSLQNGNNAFLVRYKLRADKDAINGDNEIKLKYYYGDVSAYKIATFNISVSNPRTDFDVVAQDETTLAIANIGANTASAVIVRIPDQQSFRVNGTSANIIGNLNAGDYTLTTFQLFQARGPDNTTVKAGNLTIEISYTDSLGIRRTVQKSIPFGFSISTGIQGSTGRFTQRTGTQTLNNGLLYIVIGVIGIVVVVVAIKLRTRKRK